MNTNGIELELIVDGRALREIDHKGRTYVEALDGKEFTLRIRNRSGRRSAVVPTVDGLSVMDGKPGSVDSGGYILSHGDSIDVPGFRLDNEKVANFEFGGEGTSYASSKGEVEARNVGVIGLAAFHEKRRVSLLRMNDNTRMYSGGGVRGQSLGSEMRGSKVGQTDETDALYACSLDAEPTSGELGVAPTPVQDAGTVFGKEASHRVYEVSFDREEKPFALLTVYYDFRPALIEKGVLSASEGSPDAFPVPAKAQGVGCEPPGGWKR